MASFTVVYDACVLYPFTLRDVLIRLARTGHFRARWTDEILDECFGSILEARRELDAKALARTRKLMIEAVPGCLVRGYDALIDGITLPDPKDRHVLAAAIRSGAQLLVTANLKDFPRAALEPYDIDAQDPDDFVSLLVDLAPGSICRAITEQAEALKNPRRTVSEVLARLEQQGLPQAVSLIRDLME